MRKYCPGCRTEKDTSEFRSNIKRKDGLQGYCIVCDKAKQSKHYQENKAKYVQRAIKSRQLNVQWWKDYKKTLKCSKCQEDHPSCLQFHHLNPDNKEVTISKVIRRWGKDKILQEVAKCEVLCANCHFKEHWRIDECRRQRDCYGGESICNIDA